LLPRRLVSLALPVLLLFGLDALFDGWVCGLVRVVLCCLVGRLLLASRLAIERSNLICLSLFQVGFQTVALLVDALPRLLARLLLLLRDSALKVPLLFAVLGL
jgi:hypothetical protein